jgi:hypothetical protein
MHQYRQISDQEFESAKKESNDQGAARHYGGDTAVRVGDAVVDQVKTGGANFLGWQTLN